MKFASFCWVLLLPVAAGALAQDKATTLFSLYGSISQLASKADLPKGPTSAQISSLRQQIDELYANLERLPGGTPAPYVTAFGSYNSGLRAVLKDPQSPASAEALRDISEDLKLKLDFSRTALNLESPSSVLVRVRVKAVQNQNEVKGLLVRGNSRRYGEREPSEYPFNTPTPTESLLPPGRYRIFAVKQDKVVAGQDASIGLDGANTVDVVLVLP